MSTDLPHSWRLIEWPQHVFPNNRVSARYLVNCNRDSLTKCGALRRVGRDFVIMGAKYEKWLENPEHVRAIKAYDPNGAKAKAKRDAKERA